MNEEEKEKCYAGIRKCDEFLKNHCYGGNCNYGNCDKAPPDEVAEFYKRFLKQNQDTAKAMGIGCINLIIFYANAKYGFIMRLVVMQEAENESSLV